MVLLFIICPLILLAFMLLGRSTATYSLRVGFWQYCLEGYDSSLMFAVPHGDSIKNLPSLAPRRYPIRMSGSLRPKAFRLMLISSNNMRPCVGLHHLGSLCSLWIRTHIAATGSCPNFSFARIRKPARPRAWILCIPRVCTGRSLTKA